MVTENNYQQGWAFLRGRWESSNNKLHYLGPSPESIQFPHGLALASVRLRSGSISIKVELTGDAAGRILFGFNPKTNRYFSAGIGGYDYEYVISEYLPNQGWVGRALGGFKENVTFGVPYHVKVRIEGQRISLFSNEIEVLGYTMAPPMIGDQVGLYAWGTEKVTFSDFSTTIQTPKAFVVMQFGDPFDALYSEVIKPVVEASGMEAYRADDVYQPGIILEDIITGIVESEVIIAEITPENANVFYELGYAHALKKPTILLSERTNKLPFDVSGYRCIFYTNTIKGKKFVEEDLRKHLQSILHNV